MGAKWYYADGEKSFGPITFSTLKKLVSQGTVNRTTWLCTKESGKWVAASTIRDLFSDTSPPEKQVGKPSKTLEEKFLPSIADITQYITIFSFSVVLLILAWLVVSKFLSIPIVWTIISWMTWLSIMGGTFFYTYQKWIKPSNDKGSGFLKSIILLLCVFLGIKLLPVEKSPPKVKALKDIINLLEYGPDRFASESEHRKHNEKVVTLVDTFERIPFDPSKQKPEVKDLVTLFQTKIHRKFEGQKINELEEYIINIHRQSISND